MTAIMLVESMAMAIGHARLSKCLKMFSVGMGYYDGVAGKLVAKAYVAGS